MKIISRFIAFFCAVTLLPGLSLAQTITIDSISTPSFCSGDPVSVNFTVTGTWGAKNAFTLQLSDPTGSFSSGFSNLGSVIDASPGTFNIVSSIPTTISSSAHYRFRILGASPYTPGSDNGTDISIGQLPSPLYVEMAPTYGAIGKTVRYECVPGGIDNATDSMYWDFGPDATPQFISGIQGQTYALTQTETIYSSGGLKTITVIGVMPGGCSRTKTMQTLIYDCTPPVIPSDAIVIASDTIAAFRDKVLWVNPGVKLDLTGGNYDTVYAEAGSTVATQNGCIAYLNAGAAITGNSQSLAICGPGTSVSPSVLTVDCPTFAFDYAKAPNNPRMGIVRAAVAEDAALMPVQLSPNPTTGELTIQGMPDQVKRITVLSILGNSLMELAPHASTQTIDLARFAAGTYYIRIATERGVTTKRVVKE